MKYVIKSFFIIVSMFLLIIVGDKGLITNQLDNDLVFSTKGFFSAVQASVLPLTPSQQIEYEKLTDAIKNPDSLSKEQWLELLNIMLENNPKFASYLNDEQAETLEQVYLELFQDNLVYNLENTDGVLRTLVGFILGADLQSLLDEKDIEINVVVSKEVNDENLEMITNYIKSNNFDESKVFSFDVTAIQKIQGDEVPLVLYRPVLMIGPLSEDLIGASTLHAITIHKAEVYDIELHSIDVEIENNSFIIRSDEFSAFSIFTTQVNEDVYQEEPKKEENDPTMIYLWLLGGIIVLIIISSTMFITENKYK